MGDPIDLTALSGFDWDEGNSVKNLASHDVSDAEAEQVFFNRPRILRPDSEHSAVEPRYYLLGQTDAGRLLFVAFTVRGDRVRVISARDMTKKERRKYGEPR